MVQRSCSKDQQCWDNSEQRAAQGNRELKKENSISLLEAKRASIQSFREREKTILMLPSGNQRLNLEESKEIFWIIVQDLMEAYPKFTSFSSSVHPSPSFASELLHSKGGMLQVCILHCFVLQEAHQLQALLPSFRKLTIYKKNNTLISHDQQTFSA